MPQHRLGVHITLASPCLSWYRKGHPSQRWGRLGHLSMNLAAGYSASSKCLKDTVDPFVVQDEAPTMVHVYRNSVCAYIHGLAVHALRWIASLFGKQRSMAGGGAHFHAESLVAASHVESNRRVCRTNLNVISQAHCILACYAETGTGGPCVRGGSRVMKQVIS